MPFNHIKTDLVFESVPSIETDSGRYYKSPSTGLWYPSVTTVIGHKKAHFFKQWRSDPKNAAESTRASTRGTRIHSVIEKYINNDPEYLVKVDMPIQELFEQTVPYLSRIDNILAQESPLFSDSLRMAGRFDCIAEYEGKLSIIDFKGSTKPKKEEWISNYFEQATSYSVMFEERTKIPVKQIVIIISCENGEVQPFVKKTKDYVKPLKNTIDEYWKEHNFDEIQEKLRAIEGNKGLRKGT